MYGGYMVVVHTLQKQQQKQGTMIRYDMNEF